MKIVVLSGGTSPERAVSLKSGDLVYKALKENNHEVILFDLSNGIEKVLEVCRECDIVFLALHGDIGENGKLQALFDLYNIKYTGSGHLGSALAMDKNIAKKIMVASNIKTPKWSITDNINNTDLTLPIVIKPIDSGSSIGVKIIKKNGDFSTIELAPNKPVMIEEFIEGREFSVGILENKALPIIEIIPKRGFYDYDNKYIEGNTVEICPAKLDEKITKKMQFLALKVHNELQLSNYSRIDFILDKNNDIYCLEANTLPGMTNISLLPQEASEAGISYNELCNKLLN